jgi:hypothetical protein
MTRRLTPLLVLPLAFVTACGGEDGMPVDGPAEDPQATAMNAELPEDKRAWLANLREPCGQAFPGQLERAPETSTMLEGEELLVVYFDVCEEDEVRLPFHIEQMDGEWDRSRTWIFRPHDDGTIELRHDHRLPDGSEDEGSTWYGAFTMAEGTANQQEFIREELRDGVATGWRVIIEPGVRYVYGTIRDGEWNWRVDFDLSEPMDSPPPPAWGYEDGAGPPR